MISHILHLDCGAEAQEKTEVLWRAVQNEAGPNEAGQGSCERNGQDSGRQTATWERDFWRNSQAIVWLDAQADNEELAPLLKDAPLSPDAREAALEHQLFPEATPGAGCVVLRMPLRHSWETDKAVYVTFVICPGHLLTLHGDPAFQLDELRLRLTRGDAPDVRSIPALLAFLIDGIVEMNIHQLNRARLQGEAVSERLDENPLAVGEAEVSLIRRRVGRLAGQFEDQFYGLTSLQTLHSATFLLPFLGAELKDAIDAQGHLVRSIIRLETRLRDLQQHCAYVLQGRSERRLRLLTVLSAIFMPLNLVTGLYGMNFSAMPGLTWEYGYFATLAGMGGLAVGLLVLFQRRGWFH